MNDLLELNGILNTSNFSGAVSISLPKNSKIYLNNICTHLDEIEKVYEFWKDNNIINGALISVFYSRIIPKSHRIEQLLSKNSQHANQNVRGVRFNDKGNKHIITYFLSLDEFFYVIERLKSVIRFMAEKKIDYLDDNNFKMIDSYNDFNDYNLSKSVFKKIIKDFVDVERFDIFRNNEISMDESGYITLFQTNQSIDSILNKLNISNTEYVLLGEDTLYSGNKKVFSILKEKANYLISMSMPDLAKYENDEFNRIDPFFDFSNFIKPTNEPTIGVIDTLFSTNVYFGEWVDYKDLLPDWMEKSEDSYRHGTEVDSIIVDGGHINPEWDDNCGNFKVRHFAVAVTGDNNSYEIIKKIKKIVEDNLDIKVWNLSLGSIYDSQLYTISPEAAELDELQHKYDVIFVVAGTNKSKENPNVVRIGAPADSINSLVVNSVDRYGNIPSYARKGKVLSFFIKPDVCAFGGDKNGYINVCNSTGLGKVSGTSYAAPWISRKLAFLINKIGLSKEIAKALLINSALEYKKINHDLDYLGYGIIPTKIDDVINSNRDEIKFYIEGTASDYNTYTYNIPVPIVDNKYPYYAKAVMCYFPKCSRSQGVDYTNTELNISFGRMYEDGIKSINKNFQDDDNNGVNTEKEARDIFRKWDNVKIAVEEIKNRKCPKETLGKNTWGLRITNKGRIGLESNIRFGVVITLKEMFGKNRIDDFINKCRLNGWIVNRINIENKLNMYVSSEEEIKFE